MTPASPAVESSPVPQDAPMPPPAHEGGDVTSSIPLAYAVEGGYQQALYYEDPSYYLSGVTSGVQPQTHYQGKGGRASSRNGGHVVLNNIAYASPHYSSGYGQVRDSLSIVCVCLKEFPDVLFVYCYVFA